MSAKHPQPRDEALPHSIDAEQAVLGVLLVKPDAWTDVRDVLTAGDFWRAAHQTLFGRMESLVQAGRAIDLVTLTDVLRRHDELEGVGGLAYLTSLTDAISRFANVVHYADLVREHARRRQCVVIAERLRAEALAADDLEESRARAEHALRDLDAGQAAAFTSIARAAHAGLDDLEAIAQAEDGVTGVPTGFATVDRMLGGLQGGDLVVLAARPSVGKTAAACQMAMHAALIRHVPTLFVTLEQRASQLTLRMASNAARVDLVALRMGQATEEETSLLHQAVARLSEAPITFIDARDVRMSDVRRHARLLRAQGKCSLIVLDYLTLLQPERTSTRGETREAQVAAQSRLAKSIARELGVPFVLLSQLNREFEKDAGARKGPSKPRRAETVGPSREWRHRAGRRRGRVRAPALRATRRAGGAYEGRRDRADRLEEPERTDRARPCPLREELGALH